MADQPLRAALQHIRNLAGMRAAETAPDRELLDRFVRYRDGAAFTALVERHGPMVLGLCRRVLRHTHDADDAYQATFLVLVRKAASVQNRGALASWLHGVAHHVATTLRRDLAAGPAAKRPFWRSPGTTPRRQRGGTCGRRSTRSWPICRSATAAC